MLSIIKKLKTHKYNYLQKKTFKKIEKENQSDVDAIANFFTTHQGFRTLENCAEQTKLDVNLCKTIKDYLYHTRQLGLYYFEAATPPQKYMRKYIQEKFSAPSTKDYILEIGPGEYPLFSHTEYKNWYGIDRNYQNNCINFKHLKWARNQYPSDKMFEGSFENITSCNLPKNLLGKFDFVCASHTYEHVLQPIKSLKEAGKVLRKNGILVLFVPDAYTTDPSTKDHTHTLYLTKEMILEFFHYADCFYNIEIKQFRPNADLVITAQKK